MVRSFTATSLLRGPLLAAYATTQAAQLHQSGPTIADNDLPVRTIR